MSNKKLTYSIGFAWVMMSIMMMPFQAHAADVEVEVSIVPRTTYFIDEMFEMIDNKKSLEDLASIIIHNHTEQEKQVKLRILLFTDQITKKVGAKAIADYTTNYNSFPIKIAPNSTYSISNTEISSDMVRGGRSRINEDDVEKDVEDTYGKDMILKTAGLFPEDTYTYKIYVFNKDDNEENLSNALATIEERIFVPLEFGNIDLIYPDDGGVVPLSSPQPTFIWNPVRSRAGVDITYKISIWKAEGTDYLSIVNTTPLAQEDIENKTQVTYPSNAEPLIPNQTYVWRIEAFDGAGYRVGINGQSDISSFKFGNISAPRLTELTQEFGQLPIRLGWQSDNPDQEYRLLISESESMSNPIVNETLSSPMFISSDESLFQPGITYYWTVEIVESRGDAIRSLIGRFSLKQDVTLIYPINDTIQGKTVTLYWTGVSGKAYHVKISDSRTFRNAKTYRVEGSSFTLSDDMFRFVPGTTLYWTILNINKYNEEWGQGGEVGQFKVPNLSKPSILFPKDEIVQQKSVQLMFKGVDWAESYIVQIKNNQGKVLYRMEVDQTLVNLELDKIPALEGEIQFIWQVIAEQSDMKEVSEPAAFSYGHQINFEFISIPSFLAPGEMIQWKAVPGASLYKIFVAADKRYSEFKVFETSNTSFSVEPLTDLSLGDQVRFKVAAYNSEDVQVVESQMEYIKTSDVDSLTDDIVPLSPIGNISGSRWNFKWIGNSEGGKLAIADNRKMRNAALFDSADNRVSPANIAYVFDVKKAYYWAIKKEGEIISAVQKFNIIPDKLKLLSPLSETVRQNNVSFQWVGPKNASYQLIISTEASFNSSQSLDATNLNLKTELKNGTYFWKVNQLNSDGKVVETSPSGTFIVGSLKKEVTAKSAEELEFFIKKQLPEDSVLKEKKWKLKGIQAKDGRPLTDEEMNYLLDNEDSVSRILEQ